MPRGKKLRVKRTDTKDKGAQEITRLWGDLPVMDAEHDLRVFITPDDVEGAIEKNPSECVFARACKRLYHATKVMFFRSVAYVEVPDENGKRRVERFHLSDGMRKLIEDFDRGLSVIPEAGFLLKAPSASHRIEAVTESSRKKREKAKERQKIIGERVRGKGKYESEPLVLDLSVRSGSGAVHFTKSPA